MGAVGEQWEAAPHQEVASQRALLLRAPARLTEQHLKTITRAWGEWKRWADERAPRVNRYRPTALQLGSYLRDCLAKGPTVPASRLIALRWLKHHLGVPFPTTSPCVRDFLNPPEGHQVTPADTLEPEDIWNMVAKVMASRPGGSSELQLCLFLCFSCVRYLHLQRSTIRQVTSEFISGTTSPSHPRPRCCCQRS